MRPSRTCARPVGLFGTLIAVAGLLVPAQIGASSTEPIVESLEFSDAAVLSYSDAIVADYSANADDTSIVEMALTGGQLQINELFIRYLPDTGVTDVFISLMIAGQVDGCGSSMSTLNQTTAAPVLVDSKGTATAVIDAAWTWTRQKNEGGVCFEKIVVAQWTETYTINLNFADGRASAVVAYANEVESLGSDPPVDPPGAVAATAASTPAAPEIGGDEVGAPSSNAGDESSGDGDAGSAADDVDATASQAAIAGPDEQVPDESEGNGLRGLALLGLGIAVLLLLWAGFSTNLLRRMIRAVVKILSISPKPGPSTPGRPEDPLHKTYGEEDTEITYQTTVDPVPPPPVFTIMGTAESDYRFVEAKAEHGNRIVRLETGTTVEVLERKEGRALVRLPGEGWAMWVHRKDLQMVNPAKGREHSPG